MVSADVDCRLSGRLFEALSLPLSKLNSQYLTPLDTQKRNAPLNPFYSYSPELYLLPPRAILARGLYEGVCALLRKENPELENLLGEALEQMTADAIEQFGRRPVIVRQKYRVPGKRKRDAPFEIDVIDLTDRHVFILECKKKALTNSARGGNTLAAALDFARGFLYPLVQTNRHESQLRNSEGLTLLNGETFKLDGRNLQRIAVTMTDHGSMQDRAFLRGMIATLWNSNLKSVDPRRKSPLTKSMVTCWRLQLESLNSQDKLVRAWTTTFEVTSAAAGSLESTSFGICVVKPRIFGLQFPRWAASPTVRAIS
jgi:hypothetical protein